MPQPQGRWCSAGRSAGKPLTVRTGRGACMDLALLQMRVGEEAHLELRPAGVWSRGNAKVPPNSRLPLSSRWSRSLTRQTTVCGAASSGDSDALLRALRDSANVSMPAAGRKLRCRRLGQAADCNRATAARRRRRALAARRGRDAYFGRACGGRAERGFCCRPAPTRITRRPRATRRCPSHATARMRGW